MSVGTRLQEIRKSRGFSAAELARRVGVSRQTVYAIEDGAFVPNTAVSLQLARTLEVAVEDIFSLVGEPEPEPVRAVLLSGHLAVNEGQPVQLCRVDGRLVAVPVSFPPAYLPAADGIVRSRDKSTVSIDSPADVPEDGKRLLLAGCDPALSSLNELLGSAGIKIVGVPSSSRSALRWLKEGRVHAAGSHLLDPTTGVYNLPVIRRLFPNGSIRIVTFAVWEQGLVLQRGNPKNIRVIADLGGKDVTLLNREKGAGSRDLLDRGLREAGIQPESVNGYQAIAQGHLAAAGAVAARTADCCIAPRSAARFFGLHFVPLAVERFDLSFTQAAFELPACKALLDLLNRASLRKKLQAIAGYDTAHTGELLL